MLNNFNSVALAAVVSFALGGCASDTDQQVQVDVSVSDAIPEEFAINYLRELESTVDNSTYCKYANKGISGKEPGIAQKATEYLPFEKWRITFIGSALMRSAWQPPDLMIVLKTGDGNAFIGDAAFCLPLALKGPQVTPERQKNLNKTVTALISLGVQYDPNRLGLWE